MSRGVVLVFVLLSVYINVISCESFEPRRTNFNGDAAGPRRSFVAPDIEAIDNGQWQIDEVPQLSEFNYDGKDAPRQLLMDSFKRDVLVWNFQRDSEVSNTMGLACQKCMISGNMQCVASLCRLHVDVRVGGSKFNTRQSDLEKTSAFVTGTALSGDILCSLCKHTNDVMCTMKFCVDPERGQTARDSGVQCMNGFCRWEKEAMINVGFNNYYQAWWQPQNLYYFFDHVTKEISTAYDEFISSTSQVVHGLG